MSARITKAAIEAAVRKVAKATSGAPFLLPTRTRNFLKGESERLEQESIKRHAKLGAPAALKEAQERKRPIIINPNGDQPLVLQVNALVIKSNKKHGRNDPPLASAKAAMAITRSTPTPSN
jgi:hypothetical protein